MTYLDLQIAINEMIDNEEVNQFDEVDFEKVKELFEEKEVFVSMNDVRVVMLTLTQAQIAKAKANGYTVRDKKTWERL